MHGGTAEFWVPILIGFLVVAVLVVWIVSVLLARIGGLGFKRAAKAGCVAVLSMVVGAITGGLVLGVDNNSLITQPVFWITMGAGFIGLVVGMHLYKKRPFTGESNPATKEPLA